MSEIICGETSYNNIDYCFDFRDNILVLIPKVMEKFLNWAEKHYDNNKKVNYINIEGTTNNGYYICFIHVKFSHIGRDCLRAFVPGYIICKSNCLSGIPTCVNIEKMRFYGECLDRFYYPRKALESNNYFKEESIKLSMKKNVDTTDYQINHDKFCFGIDWNLPYSKNLNIVMNVSSYLDIIFNQPINSIDKLVDYYCNVEKFFCFINNRRYVKFNKIFAYTTIPVKDIIEKEISEIEIEFEFFFTLPNEEIDLKADYNSISLKSLGRKFSKIYKEIIKEEFLTEYYPLSKKDDSYINNQKFLGVGSAFESEFGKMFPNFRSSIDKEYKIVKDSLLHSIFSRKSLTNKKIDKEYDKLKKKEYRNIVKNCTYFYKIISKIDGRLQEKINFSFKRYETIIKFYKEKLLYNYDIKKVSFGVLSDSFIKRRNAISHGNFVGNFSEYEIISYELLRICIYCITLERCGIDFDDIKFFIHKLFT